jgi:hypothetical protein
MIRRKELKKQAVLQRSQGLNALRAVRSKKLLLSALGFMLMSFVIMNEDEVVGLCMALPGIFCTLAYLKDRFGPTVPPKKLQRLYRRISDYSDDDFRLKFRSVKVTNCIV